MGRTAPQLVGQLGRPAGDFSYDSTYLADPFAQPISHSLPLREKAFTHDEASPYFEGLVPEGDARRLAAAELQTREDDYLAILAYCGLDCVGDLAICEGALPAPPRYEHIAADELRRALSKPSAIAWLNGTSRLSLAGTQSKIGLAHTPGLPLEQGWLRPCDSAASTHILKVSSSDNISYFEYLCMDIAAELGIRVARTSILDFGMPVICSERFDRIATLNEDGLSVVRLHQEDLAQANGLPSGSKYAELKTGSIRTIAAFLEANSSDPLEDLRELAKICCFNYLIGNCDNHLKNLSLLYSEDWSEVRLAPAYDLVCTTWFPRFSRSMGMAIGAEHDIDEIRPEHFEALADELGMPVRLLKDICSRIIEGVYTAVDVVRGRMPKSFDEAIWKSEDLVDDMQPRLKVLQSFCKA